MPKFADRSQFYFYMYVYVRFNYLTCLPRPGSNICLMFTLPPKAPLAPYK